MCRIMEKTGEASAEPQVTNIEPQEKAEIKDFSGHFIPVHPLWKEWALLTKRTD